MGQLTEGGWANLWPNPFTLARHFPTQGFFLQGAKFDVGFAMCRLGKQSYGKACCGEHNKYALVSVC